MKAVIFDCFGVLVHPRGVDTALFDFITELKGRGLKIGLLSNVGSDMMSELFEPEQIALFDEIVLSYQTGMAKPDHEIYQLTTNRLGVLPEESVFVDDIERFCTAAKEVGLQAIWHRDTDETVAQIEEVLRA